MVVGSLAGCSNFQDNGERLNGTLAKAPGKVVSAHDERHQRWNLFIMLLFTMLLFTSAITFPRTSADMRTKVQCVMTANPRVNHFCQKYAADTQNPMGISVSSCPQTPFCS